MPNKKKEDNIELLPADGKPTKLYTEENGEAIKLYREINGNPTIPYSEINGNLTKPYSEINGNLTKPYSEEADNKAQYQLEDIIQSLGGCGRYQIRLTLLMQMMRLPSCWSLFSVVFNNVIPRWTCADDLVDDSNITWNSNCTNKNGSKCSKFVFDNSQFKTFINEWSLVCDRDWIPYTIVSIQIVGLLFGNIIAGVLSDRIGRKKPIYIAFLIIITTNGWAFLCSSWVEMAVIRFFMGMGVGFYVVVNNILVSEVTLSGWRALTFAIPAWPIHEWLFAGISWLVPDWAYLHLITMLVVIPFLATWCFVMESIRWLIVNDKTEEADVIIHKIASINRHPYPGADMVHAVTDRMKQTAETADNKHVSILDLFKTKYLLKITVCLLVVWFTLGLGMYGIQFAISTMSGNIYLNMFLFSLVAAFSQTVSSLLCHTMGRKRPLILFYSTAALGCLGAGIVSLSMAGTASMISTVFALVGYTSFQAGWIGLKIITMELYPTVIRNRAYGFNCMFSRFGGIVAPQLALFEMWVPGMLYFVCVGCCLLTIVASIVLPETKDVALKDQLHEQTQAEFSQPNSCDEAQPNSCDEAQPNSCDEAARQAQSVERWSSDREDPGSNPRSATKNGRLCP